MRISTIILIGGLALVWLFVIFLIYEAEAEAQETVNMTVYPKTLTYCWLEYDKNKKLGIKESFVECSYMEMTNKKLGAINEHLSEWAAKK